MPYGLRIEQTALHIHSPDIVHIPNTDLNVLS